MKKLNPWVKLNQALDRLLGKPATGSNAPTPKTTPKTSETYTRTEPYVYVTKSGKKFHYDSDCPALANAWARGEVFKMALSKAKASGRSACGKCCWDYLHE